MNKLVVLIASLWVLSACGRQSVQTEKPMLCTESWYESLESTVHSGDGMGHGPDIGSDEWRSVIEFKLGIRGKSDVPDRNTPEWCQYIDNFMKRNGIPATTEPN
jgi:hypothetical protein